MGRGFLREPVFPGVELTSSHETLRRCRCFLCFEKCGLHGPSRTAFLAALESGKSSVGVNVLSLELILNPGCVAAPSLLFLLGHGHRMLRPDPRLGFLLHAHALTYKVFTQAVTLDV